MAHAPEFAAGLQNSQEDGLPVHAGAVVGVWAGKGEGEDLSKRWWERRERIDVQPLCGNRV